MFAKKVHDRPNANPALHTATTCGVNIDRTRAADLSRDLLELTVGQCVAKANIHVTSISSSQQGLAHLRITRKCILMIVRPVPRRTLIICIKIRMNTDPRVDFRTISAKVLGR